MNISLLQLGDSALPIGGYSHSWGLEAAIDQRLVRDPPTLETWVRCWLRHAVGPCEGVVVAAVCRALSGREVPALAPGTGRETLIEANELLWASLTPPSLRQASRDMGEQLLGLASVWPWAAESMAHLRHTTAREWHHAVVFATLAATAGATPEEAVGVYLHQSVLGVIGAGVRAIPIGHTHGQQVLARIHPDLGSLARDCAGRELQDAGSFCPAYEVLCDAQTRLYTRLFRS